MQFIFMLEYDFLVDYLVARQIKRTIYQDDSGIFITKVGIVLAQFKLQVPLP